MSITRRDFLFGGAGAAAGALAGVYATEQYYSGILRQLLMPQQSMQAGQIVPDFSLTGLDGKLYRLSDYEGKVPVVVNFWESWCGPCREEMPTIERFAQQYRGKAAVLSVTEDEDKNADNFAKQYNLNSFPILVDRTGKTKEDYLIWAIPTTFIIDNESRLVNTVFGQTDFMDAEKPVRKSIDDLLAGKTGVQPSLTHLPSRSA